MVKRISVFLVLCLTVTCFSLTTFAYETDDTAPVSYKCTTALTTVMEKQKPEETINVAIWLSYKTDIRYDLTPDDFDDVQDYIKWQRATDKAYYLEKNQQYAEEIRRSGKVEVTYISKFTPSVFLTVSIREISKIAALDFVLLIDYLSTEPLPEPTEDGTYLYAEKFARWLDLPAYDPDVSDWNYGTYDRYDELYYHTSAQGAKPDWTLVYAHVEMYNLWEKVYHKRIGDRVLVSWRMGAETMPYELAVYDVKSDSFFDVASIDVSDYPGLADAIGDLALGYSLGDVDMNGIVEILDVTLIQRCLAKMDTPMGEAYRDVIADLGDLDGNGMDIIDSTAIQRSLNGMSALPVTG